MTPEEMRLTKKLGADFHDWQLRTRGHDLFIVKHIWHSTAEICERLDRLIEEMEKKEEK